jgi:cation transport regulator ChaC
VCLSVVLKGRGEGHAKVKGLLYAGSEDNPNFYLTRSVQEAAHILAWSHGPSGEDTRSTF